MSAPAPPGLGFAADYDRGARALAQGGVEAAQREIHDEIVETIAVVGTPESFREKLSRYDGVVDWVRLSPPLATRSPSSASRPCA